MSLLGKRALVTGSTSGIGLAIARALADAGAEVALNGFGEPAAIAALVAELGACRGRRVRHFPADLLSGDATEGLVRSVESEFGGLDILVNNAGLQHVAPVDAFPPERWDAVLALNLTAAFRAIRAALPGMRARGWGRIVNIASVHGMIASVEKSAYVASKHGLLGLTKVVALETAREAITCNAICPGWVDTPLVRTQIRARAAAAGHSEAEEIPRLLGEKMPAAAFVDPAALGALVVFLCSEAADQIRGAALPVDGAWTVQ